MSLLFSYEDCSLVSHETYLNQIYQNASISDATKPKYKIRSDLFDLNVPYRQQTDTGNDTRMKKRQRKIKQKNAQQLITEYPNEYALVK